MKYCIPSEPAALGTERYRLLLYYSALALGREQEAFKSVILAHYLDALFTRINGFII